MSSPERETVSGKSRHLTRMDEMSLTDEQLAQTRDSEPDALEVRDDSIAVMQGTVNELRGPLLMAIAVTGAAAFLAVGLAMFIRMARLVAVGQAK